MKDYLLRYVIDNVWCDPGMDRQYSYNLKRMSPFEGVRRSYVIGDERYTLPSIADVTDDVWHIFQIGQTVPSLLALPSIRNRWIPLNEILVDHLTTLDLYVSSGIQFSKTESFILLTESQNLIIAIRHNVLFPILDNPIEDVKVYMHLYNNAWFNSDRSYGKRFITFMSKVAVTLEDVRQFQIRIMDLLSGSDYTGKYYVNGRMVSEISVATAGVGDYLEFILDPSIKSIKYFNIKDLPGFTSTLDNTAKYILHYPGKTDTIDYLDDLDIYLIKRRSNNANLYSGVSYHHNKGTWVRQLTHKDYSVPVESIQSLVAEHPEDPRYTDANGKWPSDKWTSPNDLVLKVIIRHGGYERNLVADVSRIQDLYKLSSDNILRALEGKDSVAQCWLAENLEKTRYVGFMGLTHRQVFPKGYGFDDQQYPEVVDVTEYAADALGYHSAAKLLSDSPIKTYTDTDGLVKAKLTYNYWNNVTVFEYDQQGLLLGHYPHVFGNIYYARNANCGLIEPINGKGSTTISGYYGTRSVKIPKGYNYKLYVKSLKWGDENLNWIDITQTDRVSEFGYLDTTLDGSKTWVWTHNSPNYDLYIRLDDRFYLKEMQFTKAAGVMRFSLDVFEDHNFEIINTVLAIPFGQLDVWLNGRALTEDVDYQFNGRRVVLNNLEYLIDGINKVLVRATGYCGEDLNWYKPSELGFIEYGVMSSNSQYNLHFNKVQRIIADGRVLHTDDIVFDEAYSDYTMANVRNGVPYQIQTPQVIFKEVFKDDFAARVKDDQYNKQVSDYLTFYLPKRERDVVDSIERKYKVFSAASNLILQLIISKRLKPPVVNGRLDEPKILELIKPYEYIKELDIVNTNYNANHLYVYPHWFAEPVGLEWFEYKMYKWILRDFLRKELDTSSHVYIKRTQ